MPHHKSHAELIFDHALRFIQPLRTTDGHAWAVIPDGPLTHHGEPIDSREFREWLATHFYHEHGIYPGRNALTSAIHMLRAQATRTTAPAEHVFTRLGSRGPEAILLHLANAAHEVLEITAAGSRLTTSPAWQFLTSAATSPLPRPIPSDLTVLQHLRAMLPFPDPVLHRAAIWLFAAMRPSGPYPTLVITGPEDGANSTLARALRNLIDPTSSLLTVPNTERALHTCALHHHVLAFQQVDSLPTKMSAALAALASGTGVGFYSGNPFDDHKPIPLARPIILTADSAPRTFAANSIHIRLQTITEENVLTETARATFLGSLATAVSAALASGHTDIRRWTIAAAAQLGLTTADIEAVFTTTPLVEAIQMLLATEPTWTGTPTELLTDLRAQGFDIARTPQALSQLLNITPLAQFGIESDHTWTHKSRQIRLHLTAPTQSPKIRVGTPQSQALTHANSCT